MATLQKTSGRHPEPDLPSDVAIRVGLLTERMGLVPPDATAPGDAWLVALAQWLDARGIAQRATPGLRRGVDGDQGRLESELRLVLEALEQSPSPDDEWEPLLETLGEDTLSELIGTSASSIRRYLTGERTTPDDVAARLHVLMLIVTDLAGAYNDYGIRRWFERPRDALDGLTPRKTLGAEFDPDDEGTRRVRELASSLVSLGAT